MAKKKAAAAMAAYPLERVRNIGIIAHIDAGKTTTTEQILHYTGKEHRIGTVDAGNTTTDWYEQEQERGITIFSAVVTVHWTPRPLIEGVPEDEVRINLIDTPGHIDFTAEVERALSVLDGAVAIFCGVAGVQAQSETVWRQSNTYGVPRIAFVNKLDRSGANFYEVLDDIESRLEGMTPLPVQVPIGEEKEFRGVVDLLRMKAWIWDEGDPPPDPRLEEIPEETADMAALYRDQLITRLADLDEEVGNRWLEEQEMDAAFLRAAIRRVTIARKAFPVMCGASYKHKGAQPLLDAIAAYLPSPLDRPPVKGKVPKSKRKVETDDAWLDAERPPSPTAPFCALAFKTETKSTGDLVYLRVYSGTCTDKDQLLNINKNQKERLGQIHVMHANRKEDRIGYATAGDVLGVVGLRYTVTGDTLCDPGKLIRLGAITFPLPVVSMAVEPRSTGDKDKLQVALEAMAKDDPTFTVRQDAETGQTLISGMGELHLEILAEKLRRDWKVEAKVGKPRVSYKAAVKGPARGRGVYDVERGDRRIYAEVRLSVQRKDKVPGGVAVEITAPPEAIPEEFHGVVEDAIRSKAFSVGHWYDPLIDAVVKVDGGNYDPADKDEGAFAAAASAALEDALEKAGLVSLEPIMTLTVDVPEEFYGNVIQDLQGRRANVLSTDMIRDTRRIVAAVPLSEMFGYAGDVRSKSQGRATPALEPRDYAEVPEGKRPRLW